MSQPGPLLIATVAAVVVATVIITKLSGGGAVAEEAYSLDEVPAEVAESYRFVANHPDSAARIPCYCGCGSLDHRHLLDCFVKPDGRWEEHATGCQVCQDEAVDLRQMLDEGLSIEQVRARIDEKYGSMGRPTNTP